MNPEAYITATRQCVAQANSWSLEELALEVTITEQGADSSQKDSCFGVTGLKLQGATSRCNQLLLTSALMTDLPLTLMKWVKLVYSTDKIYMKFFLLESIIHDTYSIFFSVCLSNRVGSADHRSDKLTLPVYLNSTRAELLFTVDLAVAPAQSPHSFYERGVAVLTSTALN